MEHHRSITSRNMLSGAILRTIHHAFDDAIHTLEMEHGPYPPSVSKRIRAAVARRMAELATHGVCDFEHLRAGALEAVYFDA
jgi:hypothetical protein